MSCPSNHSQNPYLLHAAITCASMHTRSLKGQAYQKRTPLEAFHWAQASALFRDEISQNMTTCDRFALWMSAALISQIVCSAVETEDPEELWPLSPEGMRWLPAQRGLRYFWQMLPQDQFRESDLDPTERCLGLPDQYPGVDGIPQPLVELCDLNELSSAKNNPYHTAVRILSTLLDRSHSGSLRFLALINTAGPGFEALLEQRDPRALTLMAIWFGLVPESAWWIWSRAQLERKAICIYLDRYHRGDSRIQSLLAQYS